jgi:D-glycero-alpha-D-manno-heptose-7-phosphate kinase
MRVSFAGGGTDLPEYYREHGGLVISTTINKYFYVMATERPDAKIQIISADYQMMQNLDGPDDVLLGDVLSLPKAVIRHYGLKNGVDLFLASEIPPGTGLGSSGAVCVAMVKLFSVLADLDLEEGQLAETAFYISHEVLGQPVGKQDEYAAAFGGLRAYSFVGDEVIVEELEVKPQVREALQRQLLLFQVGSSRASSSILREQQRRYSDAIDLFHATKELAQRVRVALEDGDLETFGYLLDEAWQYKKQFARGVSSDTIDQLYTLAIENGALGGKVAGAGGGGYLLLFCPSESQPAIRAAMRNQEIAELDFAFDHQGAHQLA